MSNVICISRQYGSGGRAIGKILAEKLGYTFYDSKLVDLAAAKGDIPLKNAEKADEKALNPWLYTPLYAGVYTASSNQSESERMFRLTSEVIREEASKHNCIFVGRSADAILEEVEDVNLLNLFIYAPEQWRIKRLVETEDYINEKVATAAMHKKDKQRRNYYNYYTGKEYTDPLNYDLCIDSSYLGIDKTAKWLCDFVRFAFNH